MRAIIIDGPRGCGKLRLPPGAAVLHPDYTCMWAFYGGYMPYAVTLIPGDGTGPEIAEATRRVLEATGIEFEWDVQDAGADVMDRYDGNPLPAHVLESIRRNRVAIKGPITTPIGTGFRSVNVGLRK